MSDDGKAGLRERLDEMAFLASSWEQWVFVDTRVLLVDDAVRVFAAWDDIRESVRQFDTAVAERDRLRGLLVVTEGWAAEHAKGEAQAEAERDTLAAQLARAETVIEHVTKRHRHEEATTRCACGVWGCLDLAAVDAYQATPATTEREGAGDE